MSKRRQKREQRILVAELIYFLKWGKRDSVIIHEYFELTDFRKHWTVEKKKLLYSGLRRTNSLCLFTSYYEKTMILRDIQLKQERTVKVNYPRLEVRMI